MRRSMVASGLMALGIMFLAVAAIAADQTPAEPRAEFVNSRFTFEPVTEGTPVIHDFTVRNTGSDVLRIEDVRTG